MREDQCERLEAVEDKLIEVVLRDADPGTWSGAGLLLCDMTKQQRGDAAWCRKTASQTVVLLSQVQRVIANYRTPTKGVPPNDPDPGEMIRDAENAARALLEAVGVKPPRG